MSLKDNRLLVPVAMGVAVLLAVGIWQLARTGPDEPGVPPVAAPRPAAPAGGGPLAEAVLGTLASRLGDAPAGSPAWLAASRDDREALARADQLAGVLTRAGWSVHPIQRTVQRNRPGYFLFVGGDEAPPYVNVLGDALKDAGLNPTIAVGYRDYAAEQLRANPGWAGISFVSDQTFVLVVGRAPD
jgi:hypothetical protein